MWRAVLVIGLVFAGCTTDSDKELLVFGASSLSDVLTDAEEAFEEQNPGVDLKLNLGGSSSLREQLLAGAPADVFMPASLTVMDQAIQEGEISGDVTVIATNTLQIVVPTGNPAGVSGLQSFADPDLILGLCASGVPCGQFAQETLAEAGVVPQLDTEEPDVRSLLNKVANGELDAGIVYVTDVVAAGSNVEGLAIPADVNRSVSYGAAVTTRSTQPEVAQAFIQFLSSTEGQNLLKSRGFTAP